MGTEYYTKKQVKRDFIQFKSEKDILPNIQWLRSLHPNGCKTHEKYYNHIWNIDDQFWQQHSPGECKDCQCRLRATDKPITDNSSLT